MEVAFHRDNYYALAICVLSEKEISIDKAISKMGLSKEFENHEPTLDLTQYKPELGLSRKLAKENMPRIIEMYYKENISAAKIGAIYGVSKECIRWNIKQLGYELKDGRETRPSKDISKKEYKRLKKKGLKESEIAELLDCTTTTLIKNRKKWGLF